MHLIVHRNLLYAPNNYTLCRRYETTQLQEGLFWTMKGPTRAKFQPLHQLPAHTCASMKRRNARWLETEGSHWRQWCEGALLDVLQRSGCSELIDKCREFLCPEAYKMMLEELKDGVVGYTVSPIASKDEAINLCNSLVHDRPHRAASASHFLCLLREVQHPDTVFLKVSSNVGPSSAVDIVVVSENGSFACTEPYFAQIGLPSRHILAVHHALYCDVNVLLHCHPRYLRKFSNPKQGSTALPIAIAQMTWAEKLGQTAHPNNAKENYRKPIITRLTSWSWAIDKVTGRVRREVFGGDAMADAVLRPAPNTLAQAPEAAEATRRKSINALRYAPQAVLNAAVAAASAAKGRKRSNSNSNRGKSVDPESGRALANAPLLGPARPTKRKESGPKPKKKKNRF